MEGKKSEFKAFDRVLVRDNDDERWQAAYYDQYLTNNGAYSHRVIGEGYFSQCIPYECHEHLLGTTDSPKPKRWKPKDGDQFYCIAWSLRDGFFSIGSAWQSNEPYDIDVLEAGNCFRTEEEAQQVIDRMNEALEGVLSPDAGRLFDAVSGLMNPNDEGHEAGED